MDVDRPEHFSGPAEKIYVILGRKILPMTIPLDASGLNFRAGLRLGRAARVFYSVKQLKIAFWPVSGQKNSWASRSLLTPIQ
jgi:hypothetical protein